MLNFKTIRWKNMLGTGDQWTEIDLHSNKTTLILGHNGCGKSQILDALSFCLFGEPFREINLPQLVNDVNERDMVVETVFDNGNIPCKVVRGLKPRLFEIWINGKLINQDAKSKDYQKYLVQNILKMDRRSFKQVVVLGSASFTPFMQLVAADRRAIVEDLLDIQIFSVMNQILKAKHQGLKDEYVRISNQIELQNEKLLLIQAYLKKLRSDNMAAVQLRLDLIVENTKNREDFEFQISALETEIRTLLESIKDKAIVNGKTKKLDSLKDKMLLNLSKTQKEIQFYQDNDHCPTCQQPIQETFKNQIVTTKESYASDILAGLNKLESDKKNAESRLAEISEILQSIETKEDHIHSYQIKLQGLKKYINQVQKELEDLRVNNDDEAEQQEKLEILESELMDLVNGKNEITNNKYTLDVVAMMLKDNGIKTKIIKQYLPIINKYVNHYLALMDFFVNFSLDENFKDSIHVKGSKERTYYQLSEGQKLRIDLAILFTWRAVAKVKNQANCNLLIMDEIFESALDEAGVEDFLKLIQILSKDVNIFIISPKGENMVDKFENTIKFVETKGFSVIEHASMGGR